MKRLEKALVYIALTALVLFCLARVAPADLSITRDILQGRSWIFSKVQTFNGGVATPAKIGTDYTLTNPTTAPTAAISAAGGSCNTTQTWRFYTAWANLAGVTALSPASADHTGQSLRRADVTRTQTVPAGALGWIVYYSGSADGHAAKKTCLSGSLDSVLVASGTSLYACSCSSSGTVHPGTNQTGFKAKIDLDIVNGTIRSGSVGSTIGSALEGVHSLDLTGATLKYDGATVGQAVRVVTIATSGGNYSDLNAACAAETSTAALPIIYSVGPGSYTGQVSCSGEDHATFRGAGAGVTILLALNVNGADGTFKPGTSTNYVFEGFTVHGHRSFYADMAGVGGGQIVIRHNEFTNEQTDSDEDSVFMDNPVANSRLFIEYNRSLAAVDGFTFGAGLGNMEVYSRGNTMLNAATNTGSSRPFRFASDPCLFVSSGDTINFVQGLATPYAINGYYFTGEQSGDCSGTSRVFINGATSFIRNTSSNQANSSANFLWAEAAAGVDEYYLSGVTALTQASDVDDTTVQGVVINSTAASVMNVVGGFYRSTGGLSNRDFFSNDAAAQINLVGVDYLSANTGSAREHASMRQTIISTAPSTCNIGDTYMDSSGAFCVCTSTNTWSNTVSVGGCV